VSDGASFIQQKLEEYILKHSQLVFNKSSFYKKIPLSVRLIF
jgi:hypothetical protein